MLPKLVQPLWKRVWTKLEIELSYDPAILLLGVNPKDMKSLCQRHICIPMFIAAEFPIVTI